MKLIIGGAYQGKGQYALEHYADKSVIANFHLKILELLEADLDPLVYISGNLPDYVDKVIICDDISCGVVPIDPLMRKWREAVGHSLALLSRESDEVVRVFCGIGTRLK